MSGPDWKSKPSGSNFLCFLLPYIDEEIMLEIVRKVGKLWLEKWLHLINICLPPLLHSEDHIRHFEYILSIVDKNFLF